jgi:single-strand selective monofunctional uracil DNA glycosylase
MKTTLKAMLEAAVSLREACAHLSVPEGVDTVYQTLGYAWAGHEAYLKRFARSRKRFLYLGMNPGPWGMAQTGVPFGEVAAVREWMGIEVAIDKPTREHPKRPVEGFACTRSEVSGRRLWSLFAEVYGSAEAFFAESLVLNYCPLSYMAASGANLTPDKLKAADRKAVEALCDAHLQAVIDILQPELAVGIGGFARKCLERLSAPKCRLGTLLHPSPASPIANRQWPERPRRQLVELGVLTEDSNR